MFKRNEYVYVIKTLEVVKIKNYNPKDKIYLVKRFKFNLNKNKHVNAEDWQHVNNKRILKFNEFHEKSLMKIDIPYSFWLIYNLRFCIKKLLRQPLPYYQKFLFCEYRKTIMAQRIYTKKNKIKKLIKDNKLLYDTIGEWLKTDKKISSYNFITEEIGFIYTRNQINYFLKCLDFLKK